MYAFDREGRCLCERSWHLSEWVMAMLLYVFCQETFKAYIETVKRTYWLQALTLCTQWLPIFHLSETLQSLCGGGVCGSLALTDLSDIGNVCLHTVPGQMDTDSPQSDRGWGEKRERERHREKATKGKFSTMDSYHQTSLQAAFVCFYLQEMNHL